MDQRLRGEWPKEIDLSNQEIQTFFHDSCSEMMKKLHGNKTKRKKQFEIFCRCGDKPKSDL